MKNKFYLFLLFAVIFIYVPQSVWGQKALNTHKGEAKDYHGVLGTIEYNYYEQDYERIKDGNFSFSYNNYNEQILTEKGIITNKKSLFFSGKFKDGLRDGIWTHILSSIEPSGSKGSFNTSCSYTDGIPDGNFFAFVGVLAQRHQQRTWTNNVFFVYAYCST